jgi:hypothetical protein
MDNLYYQKGWEPHASHQMGDWYDTIVTIIATSRFGRLRKCEKCDAEQAETAAGRAAHPELNWKCEAI